MSYFSSTDLVFTTIIFALFIFWCFFQNWQYLLNRKHKDSNFTINIYYGTESGTAEQFAHSVSELINTRLLLKSSVINLIHFTENTFVSNQNQSSCIAIFIVATYGNGEPTDNARSFHDWLKKSCTKLQEMRYMVFGLGDSDYLQFNAVAKFIDIRLSRLGASRIGELTLGDSAHNLECDFNCWKKIMLENICAHFNLSPGDFNKKQEILEDSKPQIMKVEHISVSEADQKGGLYTGEPERINSFKYNFPPFSTSNPFLAVLTKNEELYQVNGARSCRLIELDISESKIKYAAGDHLAIFPQNSTTLVDRLFHLLNADPDVIIHFPPKKSKNYFPTPCTYRIAFTHYLDICTPPRLSFLTQLLNCSIEGNAVDRDLLQLMVSGSTEGNLMYENWCLKKRRHLVSVLETLSSLRPSLDLLCQCLPRLQPRYYSIASSQKYCPTKIQIVVAIVKYPNADGYFNTGVASGWLEGLLPSDSPKVPIFLRRSGFRLPRNPMTPVIMIGPGTGIAPFRGFIQERIYTNMKGGRLGDALLFYGCRREGEDELFPDELKLAKTNGIISDLHVAFSRSQPTKVYVQHKMLAVASQIWEIIANRNGVILLCGDARHMAKDVHKVITKIVEIKGDLSENEAISFVNCLQESNRYKVDIWN